jgi:hypothetical protein
LADASQQAAAAGAVGLRVTALIGPILESGKRFGIARLRAKGQFPFAFLGAAGFGIHSNKFPGQMKGFANRLNGRIV